MSTTLLGKCDQFGRSRLVLRNIWTEHLNSANDLFPWFLLQLYLFWEIHWFWHPSYSFVVLCFEQSCGTGVLGTFCSSESGKEWKCAENCLLRGISAPHDTPTITATSFNSTFLQVLSLFCACSPSYPSIHRHNNQLGEGKRRRKTKGKRELATLILSRKKKR